MSRIDPDELLLAYRLGVFPMAEARHAKDVMWVKPHLRGILPLRDFHVPRRLARTIRSDQFQVRLNTAFSAVIRACAESGPGRRETWINDAIIDVFEILHRRGHAHSVETWHDGTLVGGLYGLSLGAAFFAESKFSRRTDASKVALVHLAARLKAGRYLLLDAQFPNPHLEQFGAVSMPEERFEALLAKALSKEGDFYGLERAAGASAAGTSPSVGAVSGGGGGGSSVLHVITQTS